MEKTRDKILSILRWSEKYTKTDMVYLFKGGFWLTFGQIISSLSVFIISIVFANLLDPEIFGIYRYILSIVGILTITTLSGIDSAVIQSVAKGFEGTLDDGLKIKIKWGLLGSVLSLILGVYYFLQGNMVISFSIGIVAIFIPFIESFDLYNSLLFGKKLFHTQTIYNSIKKIIALVSIILAVFLTKKIYIILLVYFLSIVIPNLILFLKTKKNYQDNTNSDPESIKYGKHLSFIQVINLVVSEIDKIIIFQYIGSVELAIYSLATAPTEQIKGFIKNINSLAIPKFSQKTIFEIKSDINKKLIVLGIGTIVCILLYVFLSPIFFNLFFPKYIQSILYSQILSVSILGAVLSSFLYTILESQKAKEALYKFNIYGNILNICILIPMIFYFGIWGAIITRIIIRFCVFFYTLFLVKNLK